MLNAVLDGKLDDVATEQEPFFGLHIPKNFPGVPEQVLQTRTTWPNQADYDTQAKKLAAMFVENFQQFADQTSADVRQADPCV